MEDTQSKLWFSGVAFIPYLALAGLYTWFIEGHQHQFWVAAGVLIGGRVAYAVLDSITSTVAWRLYARKRTADKMFKLFSENRMPVRGYENQTVSLYLFNIEADEDGEFSVAVRCAARQLNTLIEQSKHDGLLAGGRMEESDAFNRHSARSAVQNPLGV